MKQSEMNDYNSVVKLYYKDAVAKGFSPEEPSEVSCFAGRKYFYLHNRQGLIAKYDMKAKLFVEQ